MPPRCSSSSMLLSSTPFLHPPKPASSRRSPTLSRRKAPVSVKSSLEIRDVRPVLASQPVLLAQSSSAPLLGRKLGFRPSPELGLLSLLFVMSVAMGSFFSLAIISIPALSAFRRLAISMDKLSKVVSEEVPGTLSSLKLSGMEINDLTQQLSNLRQRISGNQYGKKGGTNKPRSHGGRSRIIN